MLSGWKISLHKSERPDFIRYFVAGLNHKCGGPAVILKEKKTKTVIESRWFFMNRTHRLDGPAVKGVPHEHCRDEEWHIFGIDITEFYDVL